MPSSILIFGYLVFSGFELLEVEGKNSTEKPESKSQSDTGEGPLPQKAGSQPPIGARGIACTDFHEFSQYRDYNKIFGTAKRFRSFKKVDGDSIILSAHTKPTPHKRISRTIKIPADKLPPARSKRTKEELDELDRIVDKNDGKCYRAFKEFAAQTNRTLASIEYQWFSKKKKKGK